MVSGTVVRWRGGEMDKVLLTDERLLQKYLHIFT